MTGARVRRTRDLLAYGRELFYFDDTEPYLSGQVSRAVPDTRPLGAAGVAGERRRDPLTGDWVVLAAHRMDRTFLPPADECPLCPSGRGSVPSEESLAATLAEVERVLGDIAQIEVAIAEMKAAEAKLNAVSPDDG